MKLFLTSEGLTNKTLVKAFNDLVGLPNEQIHIAFIPTAANITPGEKEWLSTDCDNLRKQNYVVDIVDISTLPKETWLPKIEEANVIFVGGGNTFHLMYWFEKSGLKDLIPTLLKTKVYAGISAGSMIACKWNSTKLDAHFYDEKLEEIDRYNCLGLTDFFIFPHFNSEEFTKVNSDEIEKSIKDIQMPIYALDNNSAIVINDDKVEVVSEGEWRKFNCS